MNRFSTKTQGVDVMDVEFSAIPFHLPDATSAAEDALAKALEFAAVQTAAPSTAAVLEAVRRGDTTAYQYTTYGLARQLAETLGSMDQNVTAVYLFDPDATIEDEMFGEQPRNLSVHLIVQVERKTKALASLVSGLDRALAQTLAPLMSAPRLAHVLDAQIVDTAEVRQRIGYGALLSSLHHQALLVWQR